MIRTVLPLALAAILLGGCEREEARDDAIAGVRPSNYEIDPARGETRASMQTAEGLTSMRSGENVPVSLPSAFSVYPGAQVINSTQVRRDREGSSEAGTGALIIMRSDASPAEMVQFYREQAQAAGVDVELELETEGGRMIAGKSSDGAEFSFNASRENGGTDAQLMIGAGLD